MPCFMICLKPSPYFPLRKHHSRYFKTMVSSRNRRIGEKDTREKETTYWKSSKSHIRNKMLKANSLTGNFHTTHSQNKILIAFAFLMTRSFVAGFLWLNTLLWNSTMIHLFIHDCDFCIPKQTTYSNSRICTMIHRPLS